MKRRNLEQKFVCRDALTIVGQCRAKRYKFHSRGRQEDIYFKAKQGRLKIRLTGDVAELIYYIRRDSVGPRISDHFRLPIESERDEMVLILTTAMGAIGSVRKERTVYYNKYVKINIDRVDGLGDFVELEAECRTGDKGEALRLLEATKTALGLANGKAIPGSYIDLISRKKTARPAKSIKRGFSRET